VRWCKYRSFRQRNNIHTLKEVKFFYWLGNRSRGDGKLPTMLEKMGNCKKNGSKRGRLKEKRRQGWLGLFMFAKGDLLAVVI
jgi:hypothetical protein